MIHIFLPCRPPTVTAQMKRLSMRGGKPRFFKSVDQEKAEATFEGLLVPHQPPSPIVGPVRLLIEATWPWNAGDLNTRAKRERAAALGRIPHTGKPDADNFAKALQDCLAALRFIENDQCVADLQVRKWRGEEPGLLVRIETMEGY